MSFGDTSHYNRTKESEKSISSNTIPIESSVPEFNIENSMDQFVNNINAKSNNSFKFVEAFKPSDKNNSHYRTEFRLTAYNDAIGRAYKYNDSKLDIIARSPYTHKEEVIFRVYASCSQLDDCINIVKYIAPIIVPELTSETLQKITTDINNHKVSSSGTYYGDLCLILSGSDKIGYRIMIKGKND